MSVPYITKEKYRLFFEKLNELELPDTVSDTIATMFQDTFKFDPNRNTYSKEKYHKDKEAMLKKTNGERAYYPTNPDTRKKYYETHKDEIKKRDRERYQRKKEQMLKNINDIKITQFVETI